MKKASFVRWFRGHSMKLQLAITFTFLFLVTMLSATFIQTELLMKNAKQQTNLTFKRISELCNVEFDGVISHVNAISKAPLFSSEIQESITRGKPLSEDERMRMLQSISDVRQTGVHHDVILCDLEGNIVYSDVKSSTSFVAKISPEQLETASRYFGKVYFTKTEVPSDVISFIAIRQIFSTSTFKPIGYIVVSVPAETFDVYISEEIQKNISGVVLYNADNEVIYERIQDTPSAVPSVDIESVKPGESYGESKDYLTYTYVSTNGSYRLLLYSQIDVLFESFYLTRDLLVLVSIVIAAITGLIIILLSNNITKPLRSITTLMERVQNGDTSVRFHALYEDEVGILGQNFNSMLDQLEKEMEHVALIDEEKRQVTIDILRSQINPHFIYNSMETFRMIAIENEQYELSELIACFGKIMRYNVSQINELTTLEQEMVYLQYYIRIQNTRYNGRIIFEHDIEKGLEKQRMLRLLIQPLIENSILHGMHPCNGKAIRISVKAFTQADNCVIQLSDDGQGITETKLAELHEEARMSYLQKSRSSSVGLRNIRERIELHYGKPYGIDIQSVRGKGSVISLTIPRDTQ